MAISIRLNSEDEALFRKYAEMNRMSVSEMVRSTVLAKIEEEYDLKVYREALNDHEMDRKALSLRETEQKLGLR